MKILLLILASLEVILIIWFPFISFYLSKPSCIVLIYIIFCIVFFLNNNLVGLKSVCYVPCLKSIGWYIILTIVGSFFAYCISRQFCFKVQVYKALVMYIVYAYSFYILCKDFIIFETIRYTILFCGFSLGLYSIYSYYTQSNIYTDYFSLFMDSEVADSQFNDYSDKRGIAFRVYGNLNNPVFFSVELVLMLSFVCYEYLRNGVSQYYRYFLVFTMVILLWGIFLTGSKSGIYPAIAILFFIFTKEFGSKSIIIYSLCMFVYLLSSPSLSEIFNINFDIFMEALNPFEQSEKVGGSTVGHRENQFLYLFEFIGEDGLFGRGYGWARNYTAIIGIHPILHTFESLVMSSYADGGIWGMCLVYPYFFYSFFKCKNDIGYRAFLLVYFFTMIVTGIGCFIVFIVLHIYINTDKRTFRYELQN